jgi:hypothetical protein
LPEASARARGDAAFSEPRRAGRRTERVGFLAATWRRLRATPARGYAAAALAAVLTGIVVNALILQHERHPAPFFAARAPAVQAPTQAAKAADATIGAAQPPARPADLGGGDAIGDVLRADAAKDPIGEILRADAAKDAEKQMLAAQYALIKLGYSLKADGSPGAATSAALRDFERVHSLPPSSDLTPRLVKQLTAAANASVR